MKKLIYFSILIVFFIAGCSENSNIVAPVESSSTEPNWISAPSLSLQKDATVSRWINGWEESLLEINDGWASGTGWISITSNARFQRYSFSGSRYITMSVNDQCGTSTFTPSGTFSKPVIYNLTIVGLDLSNVNPATVKFVYMAPDGNYYVPKYERLYVEKQSGKLQIVNAQLPHFSRYGFVN